MAAKKTIVELIDKIRGLLKEPPYSLHSSFEAITRVGEYRNLVAFGESALPILCENLKKGDLFLNRAILEIAGLTVGDLGVGEFPTEQDVAASILETMSIQIAWTATSDYPTTQSAMRAEVTRGPVPFTAGQAVIQPQFSSLKATREIKTLTECDI